MKSIRQTLTVIQASAVLVVVVAFTSCSSGNYAPENSKFLKQAAQLSKEDDVPFKKSWRSPDLDWSKYEKVVIAPVSLEHLRHSEKVESDPHVRAARDEAAIELSRFTNAEFTKVFNSDKRARFTVVASPEPGAIVCETALTEFVPAKPFLNAAATGVGLAGSVAREVAMNAGGAVAKSTSRGVIAIEVQLKDAITGEALFTFADRERGKPSLVSIKDFQKLGHAKGHIRQWAKQTLAVIKKKPNQRILELPVEIKPW